MASRELPPHICRVAAARIEPEAVGELRHHAARDFERRSLERRRQRESIVEHRRVGAAERVPQIGEHEWLQPRAVQPNVAFEPQPEAADKAVVEIELQRGERVRGLIKRSRCQMS